MEVIVTYFKALSQKLFDGIDRYPGKPVYIGGLELGTSE
jgi:hypothetical protein